jgi:uncharacterized protein
MPQKIIIESGNIKLEAELNDTQTAKKIAGALPIEEPTNTWGEEIYFEVPVSADLEEGARADVEVGEIGYWPTGSAFCVFFGRTPASDSDKPKAASAVTIIGNVTGDSTILKSIKNGDIVKLRTI